MSQEQGHHGVRKWSIYYEKDDKEFRTLLIDYYEEFDNDNKEKEFKKFLIKNQSEMEQGFGIEEKVEIEKER